MIAGFHLLNSRVLRFQHYLVNRSLLGRETAADRKRARDIRSVKLVFASRIDQQQITVRKLGVVLSIVQNTGVGAAADDRVIGNICIVAPELVRELSHDFIFHPAGCGEAHGAFVCAHRDRCGAAHHLQLSAGLVQPHVVQGMIERHELLRRMHTQAGARLQAIDPADHSLVKIGVEPHRVVDARAALHESGQDVVDVVDGKRIIGAIVLDRALGPRAPPIPGLAQGIAFAHEQHAFRVRAARDQHCNRLGFAKSR